MGVVLNTPIWQMRKLSLWEVRWLTEGHPVRVECPFSISKLGSTSPIVLPTCLLVQRVTSEISGWAGVPRITLLSPWDEGIKDILYLLPFRSHTVCGHPALLSECQPLGFSHRDLPGSYFGVRKPRNGVGWQRRGSPPSLPKECELRWLFGEGGL